MLKLVVVAAFVGLASAGYEFESTFSSFFPSSSPRLSTETSASTTVWCPYFDWQSCFYGGGDCYSVFDYWGCENCVCEDDGDLSKLVINILHHLAWTAHTDSLQAEDLASQISLFTELIGRISGSTVSEYYYGYKRALREVRSMKKEKPSA